MKVPDDNVVKTDETLSTASVLGARPTSRLLIIARHAGADDAAVMAAAGVDDTPRLRSVLEAADHSVSVASPAQWSQAVKVAHPEIVILDAALSEDSAQEICRALKQDAPGRPVLAVLSGQDESTLEVKWRTLQDAGADDFIAGGAARFELENRVMVLSRLAQMIRENEASKEHLARHMQIDEATQLLNRRFFFQAAHREVSRARRYGHMLSCLMVDIDYLDDVSKTFGYACVEYILRAVSYTVRQWTRDSDVAGRFSERKFAVLLPETDIEGAVTVREKILNAIAESQFRWEGQDLPITVSVGEADRRYERMFDNSSPAADDDENKTDESALDESENEPLSVREELAALLEDADAALNVARRSSMRPGIFVQYTPGGEAI